MFKSLYTLSIAITVVCASAATAGRLELDLGGQVFDPLVDSVSSGLPATWQRTSATAGFRLVQFSGPIQRSWRSAMIAADVAPVQYIHPYAYVVWADPTALQRIAEHPAVRWTGDFLPAYKVPVDQRQLDDRPRSTMLLRSRQASRASFDTLLAGLGAELQRQMPLDVQLELVQVLIPGTAYLELAQQADVYAIQQIPQGGGARGESSNQSIVGAIGPAPGNTILPGYANWLSSSGYNGDGVTVAIVDGGIRSTHLDLASRMRPCVSAGGSPSSCSSANDAHGTHVAGAVAGTASTGALLGGFLRGQGVAPGAQLVQQRYLAFLDGSGPGAMIANGMLILSHESVLSGAALSNNSWGPGSTPQGYDIPTQQVDMITRDANPDLVGAQPLLAVWSIMNGNGDGFGACAPSSLGSPDEAKNLFAVGSTKLWSNGSQLSAIFDVSANSAHGNACDGRRVPHIVAPGCSTDSTTSSSDSAHSSSFCGTSMASPVVSGAVALFIQKYRALNSGATPSPALVKAVFTAAAQDLQGFRNADNGVMGHRPDRFQGYGRIQLDAVMNPAQAVVYREQGAAFTESGQNWSGRFEADDPQQPMRIMLAWTDAKGHGLGGSTPAWVNDLDLRAVGRDGTYAGNDIGADGWSEPGGSGDERNNLEAIHLRPDQHDGAITLRVAATNIAADALNPYAPGEPAQDFALACYNCIALPQLGSANLGLALAATPDPVTAGAQLVIHADLYNRGPDEVTNAVLRLRLPPQLSFESGIRTAGAGTWSCTALDAWVECVMTVGALPTNAGSAVSTLAITTQVAPLTTLAQLSVIGEVDAPQFGDNELVDNTATLQTTVRTDVLLRDGFE